MLMSTSVPNVPDSSAPTRLWLATCTNAIEDGREPGIVRNG